ncbi:MAG: cadmium-translocating P-type ATPase [Gammaproteobacteria bacterium]|nr:cadmium-translocating P-type ATPase [Gammaproteobacteria bacterium]MBL6999114.1 cadmium-translocating P-type ATPase [Gammaproteobacteria bacterium]
MASPRVVNSSQADGGAEYCFHCGLPLKGSELVVEIDQQLQPMCCTGCQAVADAIVRSGNTSYYRFREDKSATGKDLVPEFLNKIKVYDHPAVQQQFVHSSSAHVKQVSLIIEGIVCAACIWLNEQYLRQLPGIISVNINYSTHRAHVEWDDERLRLSEILAAISSIGYLAHPYDPATQQQLYENQRKQLIRQIGIAGLFGMQIMIFAVALYGGDWWGISESFRSFFRVLSLLLSTPIMLYSARPFFRGAWMDLKHRRAGMDVPVTLGLTLAFSASCYNTWTGESDVYFDSVAMFVFLLLSVRLFELSARKKAAEKIETLTNLTPAMSNRLNPDGSIDVVPTVELTLADTILVKPGETIPTDGVLLSEQALVDEALLTGEQHAVTKQAGDILIGGSFNLEQPIQLQVHQLGQDTVLSGIKRLIEQAQGFKPNIAQLADRVASIFVSVLLLLVVVAGIVWWQIDPTRVLPVLVATLVVTCPCALSLATPASLSAAIGALTRDGMLVAKSRALEVMPLIDTVIFDKTGTLTSGVLSLQQQFDSVTSESATHRRIAHSLELHSEHPIARALVDHTLKPFSVKNLQNKVGNGIQGEIDGVTYYIGNAGFIAGIASLPETVQFAPDLQVVHLVRESQWLASFCFSDPLKSDALLTVQQLTRRGIDVRILSGDRQSYVASIAGQLGIEHFDAEQLPGDKLQKVKQLQLQGHKVAMVGDGINDAPVLAAADLSISLSVGTDLARAASDMIINGGQLAPIVASIGITTKMMRIIRQNFFWAIGYNLVAVPFSMAGLVPPWLAAIGMSLSSLIVVLNALRLRL